MDIIGRPPLAFPKKKCVGVGQEFETKSWVNE
jgi:hypothetical protein